MPKYRIASTGNGAFWAITRLSDGASCFLQGDDALAFGHSLECTHPAYTDDDVCDEYADVLEGVR